MYTEMHSINIRNKNSAAAALKQCKNRLLNELMWLFKKKKTSKTFVIGINLCKSNDMGGKARLP